MTKSDSYMCVELWGSGGVFVTQSFYFDIMVDSKQMFLKEGCPVSFLHSY